MERETLLLLAIGMLVASATAVGVCGWTLVARDRRLYRAARAGAGDAAHHEGREES
jgi:hypothetical protein